MVNYLEDQVRLLPYKNCSVVSAINDWDYNTTDCGIRNIGSPTEDTTDTIGSTSEDTPDITTEQIQLPVAYH